jgi:ureidoglycolate lyase
MKLASFLSGGREGVGAVTGRGLVPLDGVAPSMQALIAGWEAWAGRAAEVAATGDALSLDSVRLLAPIARPGKILAIGLNYKDHIAESGLPTPEHQLWFCKHATAVNGPYDPIQIPRVAPTTVDYEAELVAVIGRRGRHISAGDAPAHIFGYCVGNDVSVREWQRHTPQWMLGKSFDTHAPFGPWIVTADEIGDPHALGIRALVNGEERQRSNTRHLLFDVFAQVEHLSKAMTLEPGDLIFTGTPGGVGAAMKPPQFLNAGDVVTIEIEKIGAIEARMVPEE